MASDTVTYAVVVNQPGYLPESEPLQAETLHEARELAAAIIRDELCSLPEPPALSGDQLDDLLMAAYDVGPDGGHLPLPGSSGYLVDVQPVW